MSIWRLVDGFFGDTYIQEIVPLHPIPSGGILVQFDFKITVQTSNHFLGYQMGC